MASKPPVYVEARDGDSTLYLWNTEENTGQRKANPRVDAIYSTDSDETFLVGITEEERIRVRGTATGLRISQESGYSNDPLDALCEWAAALLARVNGLQGTGWNFVNDFTGRSLPGVIESVDLTRRRGAKYEVEWSIVFRVGEAMMPWEAPDPPAVSPTTSPTIDGQDLHEITTMRISKSQKIEVHKFALHPVEENGIEALSGAKKKVTLQGKVPGQESKRTTFDDAFRSAAGSNSIVPYVTSFPGTSIDVMISDFESTREAGRTRIGDYNLTVIEGVTT